MYNIPHLKEAATDIRHLLNRGYNRKSIIELVGNRWNLNRDERHILYRSIFSYEEIKARKWNEVKIEKIIGKIIAIDTYNVLITIESFLKGLLLIEADDGYLRDISKVSNKYKQSSYTVKAIQMILKKLKPYQPKRLLFFLDKDISRSGELAAFIKKELSKFNVNGESKTVPSPDKSVIKNGEIVISSDRVILENSMAHINLISLLLENFRNYEINLLKLL
ncbi:MAG: DUF434 domain-containing protein [Promethearchaeota archaeon]